MAWLIPAIEGQKIIAVGQHARNLGRVVKGAAGQDAIGAGGLGAGEPRCFHEIWVELDRLDPPDRLDLQRAFAASGELGAGAGGLAEHRRQLAGVRVAQVDEELCLAGDRPSECRVAARARQRSPRHRGVARSPRPRAPSRPQRGRRRGGGPSASCRRATPGRVNRNRWRSMPTHPSTAAARDPSASSTGPCSMWSSR